MEGRPRHQIKQKYQDLYTPALIANWKVWPLAQVNIISNAASQSDDLVSVAHQLPIYAFTISSAFCSDMWCILDALSLLAELKVRVILQPHDKWLTAIYSEDNKQDTEMQIRKTLDS